MSALLEEKMVGIRSVILLTCKNGEMKRESWRMNSYDFSLVEEQDPSVLIRMLNNCIKEPHSHLAVFVIEREGLARLDFIQNMEYKFVELLSCNFIASPEDVIRAHICFRYNTLKSRLSLVQARLQDIESVIKVKNPSLLLQLSKASTSRSGMK
eukprot:754061-Hanusia_phi.AAC.1